MEWHSLHTSGIIRVVPSEVGSPTPNSLCCTLNFVRLCLKCSLTYTWNAWFQRITYRVTADLATRIGVCTEKCVSSAGNDSARRWVVRKPARTNHGVIQSCMITSNPHDIQSIPSDRVSLHAHGPGDLAGLRIPARQATGGDWRDVYHRRTL